MNKNGRKYLKTYAWALIKMMDNLFNMNINFNLKLLENPNVKSEHANAQVISIILPEYTEKNY